MKIQNGIAYPDGTDQAANFRHQTITGPNGETFFFAPVRVRNEDDLKTFRVEKDARWTLPFGKSHDKIKVLSDDISHTYHHFQGVPHLEYLTSCVCYAWT